jgi:methyl-accepting chemotaxis protein
MPSWFANLRLSWKVMIAPVFLIVALLGVGTYASREQSSNEVEVNALIAGPVHQAEVVADFSNAALQSQNRLYQMMATAANETDAQKIKKLMDNANVALGEVAEKMKLLEAAAAKSGDSAGTIAKLKTAVANYIKQAKNVIEMADGDAGTAMVFMMRTAKTFEGIGDISNSLIKTSNETRDNSIANNDHRLDQQKIVLIGILAAVVIIGFIVSLLIGRAIAKPITELVPELNRLAGGDFTLVLPALGRKDEIGQISAAIATVLDKVGSTIGSIKAVATEVTSASAEISTSTTDLSQRTEEQAAGLEQTSASMEQMASIVAKNAENARHADTFAAETNKVAERGGTVVGDAVAAMARIEESSRKISDIIGVIDEIARQTNLLALNAAVEAARAGEAGRGFAVVASEVRSLAQRSAQAAKDIKDLITNSNSQVKDGVDLVNKTGISLNEIVVSIQKVSAIVREISNASHEQATGIEEINKALNQMDMATQQNSALVEENAATAKMLEEQARSMDERVASFRLPSAVAMDDGEHEYSSSVTHGDLPLTGVAGGGRAVVKLENRMAPAGDGGKPVSQLRTMAGSVVKRDPDWKEFSR